MYYCVQFMVMLLYFPIPLHLSIIIEMTFPMHSLAVSVIKKMFMYYKRMKSLRMLINGSSRISTIPSHPLGQSLRP